MSMKYIVFVINNDFYNFRFRLLFYSKLNNLSQISQELEKIYLWI